MGADDAAVVGEGDDHNVVFGKAGLADDPEDGPGDVISRQDRSDAFLLRPGGVF